MTYRVTHLTDPRVPTMLLLSLGLTVLMACSPAAPPPAQTPTPTVTVPLPTPTPAIHEPPAPLPQPRSPSKPATVLLLGTDRRGEESNLNNTDTLMLLHLDPDGRRVAILSIPRDLYVEIPGYGQDRVNTAYARGERDGTGGLSLARQVVSNTLGVPVQHAVLLDFHAFVTLVDAIGGVDVDVPHDIRDPNYPDEGDGYDPFYLPAGEQNLDGETALKYARTRATPGGDFDRTARQRQLVLAVRDRITQLDLLPGLIAQSPQLWSALQSAFETDLALGEIVDLAVVASRVPADQIVTASIDQSCTSYETTPAGAQVLLPDQVAIEALVTDLFVSSSTTAAAQ